MSAEASVEALQAYLIAYVQSMADDDRHLFMARMHGEQDFAARALALLHLTHDAMTACVRPSEEDAAERGARLADSSELIEPALADMINSTLGRFSPAIVMDLDGDERELARRRLEALSSKVSAKAATLRLH